jgi:hypothetical protein
VGTQNPELRAALKDWLRWLSDDIGFDCWRFDFARGYAPQYVKEYIMDTVGVDNTLNAAEFWTDGGWAPRSRFMCPAWLYSDAKVANRTVRVRHGAAENGP